MRVEEVKVIAFIEWLISIYQVQRHNIVIVTGTKNEIHMKQDLNILTWNLDEKEMAEMDRLIWLLLKKKSYYQLWNSFIKHINHCSTFVLLCDGFQPLCWKSLLIRFYRFGCQFTCIQRNIGVVMIVERFWSLSHRRQKLKEKIKEEKTIF